MKLISQIMNIKTLRSRQKFIFFTNCVGRLLSQLVIKIKLIRKSIKYTDLVMNNILAK